MTLLAASCVPRDPLALVSHAGGKAQAARLQAARSSSKHPQMDELDTGYTLGELNLLPFGKVGILYSPPPMRENGESRVCVGGQGGGVV